LGNHLAPGVGPAGAYTRSTDYRNPSTSPPTLSQQGAPTHGAASSSHSPLTFTVTQGGATSPAMKRKQIDPNMTAQLNKRRRGETAGGGDEGDSYDMDGGGQGAKHWTDDEKSKLFSWLMGPGQEDHWNSLRATKNSCLREVSRTTSISEQLLTHNSVQYKCLAGRKHTKPSRAATNGTSTCSSRFMRSKLLMDKVLRTSQP